MLLFYHYAVHQSLATVRSDSFGNDIHNRLGMKQVRITDVFTDDQETKEITLIQS